MALVPRRSFLASLGAGLVAPASLRARADRKRLPIAFSTLGCPAWSFERVLAEADRLGYAAIELRGIEGDMDLPKRPELSGSRLRGTRRDLEALGLRVACLGASARMHEKAPAVRAKQLEEGRRFVDLAHELGVPYVRMFGDAIPKHEPRAEVLLRIVEGFQEMAGRAKAAGVTVLIESHGDFTRSADLEAVLTRVGSDAFALLWDAHHTFVAGQESPADTYARLGRHVRHTHLKDSKPADTDRRYVLLGAGEVPVRQQVKVLASAGYAGYYCLEWEKKWHPELEDPETAFPHYATVMAGYLAEAGVKTE